MASTTDSYTSFMFFIIPEDDITSSREFRKITKAIEKNTVDVDCEEIVVASSAMGNMSSMMSQGMQVNIYGDDSDKLIEISKDVMSMVEKIEGCENVSNGLEESDKQVHLVIDKNKAAKYGLTVAQIYQQLASELTTEKTAMTLTMDGTELDVNVVDETDSVTYENILDTKVTATSYDEEGKEVKKKYKLSKFAEIEIEDSASQLSRLNQTEYMSVTADAKEGYNTTLMSRELQDLIDEYEVPEGYSIEISGETEQVMDMIKQLCLALALGLLLIYLVMVAQFPELVITVYHHIYSTVGIYRWNDWVVDFWTSDFSGCFDGIHDSYGYSRK